MANENAVVVQYYNKYINEWVDFRVVKPDDSTPFAETLVEVSRFMDNSKTRVIQRTIDEKVILNG